VNELAHAASGAIIAQSAWIVTHGSDHCDVERCEGMFQSSFDALLVAIGLTKVTILIA
jgi:hypothetical protein